MRQRIPVRADSYARPAHPSEIDLPGILGLLPERYVLLGLWVQSAADLAELPELTAMRHPRYPPGDQPVHVGIQYGWAGMIRSAGGDGRTPREATEALKEQLRRRFTR